MDVQQAIRNLIVAHHRSGHSIRNIAKMVKIPKSTVGNIIRRFQITGSSQSTRIGRCGRPRKISERVERALLRASVKNPAATARQLRGHIGGLATCLSIRTVQRGLIRRGRSPMRPKKSPNLDKNKCRVRLQWCREHSDWTIEQWEKVRHPMGFPLTINRDF